MKLYDLRRAVEEKLYELEEHADEDVLYLFDKAEDTEDEDEYWDCYKGMAKMLGIDLKLFAE